MIQCSKHEWFNIGERTKLVISLISIVTQFHHEYIGLTICMYDLKNKNGDCVIKN